mmetsp:Transcript_17038/g.30447  ORF Transcript_17038/g.30447 Transcript_17038/m.30447 type:complete len:287 (-) Transcript_17038:329-1189(-)
MATTMRLSIRFSACRVWMRMRGNFFSTGTNSTLWPPGRWLLGSSEPQYPRCRQLRFTIPTTTPVARRPVSPSSPSPNCVAISAPVLTSSSSAAASLVGSLLAFVFHCASGSSSTATMSPSIARFMSIRPLIRMSCPTASQAIRPSYGLKRLVLSAPWWSRPDLTPAVISDRGRCSSNTRFRLPFFSPAASSSASAASPSATRSSSSGASMRRLAYSCTLHASMPSSVAFRRQSTSLLSSRTEGEPSGRCALYQEATTLMARSLRSLGLSPGSAVTYVSRWCSLENT